MNEQDKNNIIGFLRDINNLRQTNTTVHELISIKFMYNGINLKAHLMNVGYVIKNTWNEELFRGSWNVAT